MELLLRFLRFGGCLHFFQHIFDCSLCCSEGLDKSNLDNTEPEKFEVVCMCCKNKQRNQKSSIRKVCLSLSIYLPSLENLCNLKMLPLIKIRQAIIIYEN